MQLHPIPIVKTIAKSKKIYKKWSDFVKFKRAQWKANKSSAGCSSHFTGENNTIRFSALAESSSNRLEKRLKRTVVHEEYARFCTVTWYFLRLQLSN